MRVITGRCRALAAKELDCHVAWDWPSTELPADELHMDNVQMDRRRLVKCDPSALVQRSAKSQRRNQEAGGSIERARDA